MKILLKSVEWKVTLNFINEVSRYKNKDSKSRMQQGTRNHLQHGTPAPISTSGDITVVFSPRMANVTEKVWKERKYRLVYRVLEKW